MLRHAVSGPVYTHKHNPFMLCAITAICSKLSTFCIYKSHEDINSFAIFVYWCRRGYLMTVWTQLHIFQYCSNFWILERFECDVFAEIPDKCNSHECPFKRVWLPEHVSGICGWMKSSILFFYQLHGKWWWKISVYC